MKTQTFSAILVSAFLVSPLASPLTTHAQSVTGGSVTQGTVTGGSVRGGDVRGGDVTGGSVTGGSVTGGSVTGGNVTGGNVSGGSVSGGSVTPGTVTPGKVQAFAGGREINVSAAGSSSINVNGDNAQVNLGSQVLQVEKSRLVLDGKEVAKLDPGATKVNISVQEEMLSVKAGAKEVFRVKLEAKKP